MSDQTGHIEQTGQSGQTDHFDLAIIGTGSGNSKKEAEQEAAADAWRRLSAPATARTTDAPVADAAEAPQLKSQTGS